jgi:hypothetical protein
MVYGGAYFKVIGFTIIIYVAGITLGLIFGASCLYWMKKNHQFWYGMFEFIFAVLSGFISIFNFYSVHVWSDMTTTEIFIRTAAFYLIVRGINNMDDGLGKPFFQDVYIKTKWRVLSRLLFNNNTHTL